MTAGREWPVEWTEAQDTRTNVRVVKLTEYMGHSHHVYFTNSGWYDDGRRLLFGSDRGNRTNLFSVDLQLGVITQLTDLKPVPKPRATSFLNTCVNPTRPEAYFWYDREVMALDLRSLKMRPIFQAPPKYNRSMINCTADGKHVCGCYFQDLSDRIRIDYLYGYVGFEETWALKPHSVIFRAATDGSASETVWEEKLWIGHVNTSPTQSHLLTFCHEGPWVNVDNRIWGLDVNTRKAWKIRPREAGEMVGHEYWHADGIQVGYHGRQPNGRKFFGRMRYDNTGRVEVEFPHETGHIHSNDASLIVGHGAQDVRLWKWNGKDYGTPRILCIHRSSGHIQQVHVHPRFNAEGTKVLYTSDRTGYGSPYLADVPSFESLPEVKGI